MKETKFHDIEVEETSKCDIRISSIDNGGLVIHAAHIPDEKILSKMEDFVREVKKRTRTTVIISILLFFALIGLTLAFVGGLDDAVTGTGIRQAVIATISCLWTIVLFILCIASCVRASERAEKKVRKMDEYFYLNIYTRTKESLCDHFNNIFKAAKMIRYIAEVFQTDETVRETTVDIGSILYFGKVVFSYEKVDGYGDVESLCADVGGFKAMPNVNMQDNTYELDFTSMTLRYPYSKE